MKIIYSLLLMSFFGVDIHAQNAMSIAQEFGRNVRLYALTDSLNYRNNIDELCNGKSTRIADDLMYALATINNYFPMQNSYTLDSYLNLIEKTAINDSLDIDFSDFKKIDRVDNGSFPSDSSVEYISCLITVKGIFSLCATDLIYIRKGKVTLVSRYNEITK